MSSAEIPEEDILGMIDIQVSQEDIDALWGGQGYGVTSGSMHQAASQVDEVLESTLNALAVNVKGLLDTTGEQKAELQQTADRVAANSAAIESLRAASGGGGGSGASDSDVLQDVLAQLNELLAFKAEASQKMQQLEATVAEEQAQNAALREQTLGSGAMPGSSPHGGGGGGFDLGRLDDEINELRER